MRSTPVRIPGAACLAAWVLVSLAHPSAGQACGTTVPPGPIPPSSIWDLGGSPYCITGDIQVGLLEIKPGVQVLVDGPYRIEVQTVLQAQGTRDAPIIFAAKSAAVPWNGIWFNGTGPGSRFAHTIIRNSAGGGVNLANCSPPSFESCAFQNNSKTGTGGAIDAAGVTGTLALSNCEFAGNTSTGHGGAMRVQLTPGSAMVCEGTTFLGNRSNPSFAVGDFAAGALYLEAGDATLRGCRFDSNRANSFCSSTVDCAVTARGGALYIDNGPGTATLQNCSFADNISDARNLGSCSLGGSSSSFGAGVYVQSGTVELENCILACGFPSVSGAGCGPQRDGAGLYVNGGTVTVNQCTVARNWYATGLHRATGSLTITNSIIFDNNAGGAQIGGAVTALYCNVQGGHPGAGNISMAPAFAGAGCSSGDLTIALGSPCIDAGNPAWPADGCSPPARGTGTPDMGAHGGPLGCNWGAGLTSSPTSPAHLSVSSGGVQTFTISPGSEYALDIYILLGSYTGFAPGFAIESSHIPLNIDAYFDLTVGSPGATTLSNSIGLLDGGGQAQSTFTLPAGLLPALAGHELYHAAIVLHLTPTLLDVAHVTNPVAVQFTP